MKINILLTFDYELPLGGVAKSYTHSLFKPTEQLLEFSKQTEIPVILFADILSYVQFKKSGIEDFYLPFKNQLQKALKQGCDVQLHLHPHWLETQINNSGFVPSDKFKLSDFYNDTNPDIIDEIVSLGVNELNVLCKEVDNSYKCCAYRAGGYNLWPHTNKIVSSLLKHGILFDSSISPGYFYKSDQNIVDYRNVPQKPNWFLPDNGNLHKEGNTKLLEIPIASAKKVLFERPTALKMKKYSFRAPENRGSAMHSCSKLSFTDKLNILKSYRMLTVDNYTYSKAYLNKMFDRYINRFKTYDEISLALIGHPKSMGDYSFELLESFIAHVKGKYKNEAKFVTYQSLLA